MEAAFRTGAAPYLSTTRRANGPTVKQRSAIDLLVADLNDWGMRSGPRSSGLRPDGNQKARS